MKSTVQNTEIPPNFLMWNFVKTQFLESNRRVAHNTTVTICFHKIFTPGN